MRIVRLQNLLLLLVSYLFYALLDARMLWLLAIATLLTYVLGRAIARQLARQNERRASLLTTLGVTMAVAVLVTFKTWDFFAPAMSDLLQTIGYQASWTTLRVVLPVGLSFYTFKIISYLVEVHRQHLEPERDIVTFAAYIAFFPTILSGPIDRPQHFLPQLHRQRHFTWDNLVAAFRMILWGAVLKICIADTLAPVTDMVWQHVATADRMPERGVWWTFLVYPIQMYTDFAGYSLIAIGVGRLLGFRVARNFQVPFMARNVAEYWRRWHISLTGWITDYVFMPLNLRWRDYGRWGLTAAVTANLLVIAVWHGVGWTYVLFGLYHALLFVPLIWSGAFMRRKKFRPLDNGLPSLHDASRMVLTYLLVAVAFVLFRAPDVSAACSFFANMMQPVLPSLPNVAGSRWIYLLLIAIVMIWEYIQRDAESPLDFKGHGMLRHRAVRYAVYYALLLLLYMYCEGTTSQFIYTQF